MSVSVPACVPASAQQRAGQEAHGVAWLLFDQSRRVPVTQQLPRAARRRPHGRAL